MRSIVHFYIPSFHAAIEQLRKPELVGRQVVVTHRSGSTEFVISVSPEAKAEGACEGMTARHAGRYCPDGVFIPAGWGAYKDASDKVLDILSGYSPLLEPHWLDRAYMDLTGTDKLKVKSGKSKVAEAQHIIMERVGLTASAGVAQNKLLAQAAASACKAGECLLVEPGSERDFLAPLPVSHLPGIGPKIENRLQTLGVLTIGELAAIPGPMLARQFGAVGTKLHRLAQGIDFSPVKALYPPETIIIEHTFDSISDAPSEPEAAQEYLCRMSDRASMKIRMRSQRVGAVSLRIEFDDGNICTRSYIPKSPISSMQEIYLAARRILRQEMYGERIVLIRLTLSDLRTPGGVQLNFLEDEERKARLHALFTRIHDRFGEKSLVYGNALVA